MMAQYMAMPEEAQEKYGKEMKGGKKGEGMMEEAMHVYFGI